MSCKNRNNSCNCRPTSPCDEKQDYCCICYSHQWFNAPRYSECSRRIRVNDLSDSGCGCGCSYNQATVTQDNFSYNTCNKDCSDNNGFNEIDEIYWQ